MRAAPRCGAGRDRASGAPVAAVLGGVVGIVVVLVLLDPRVLTPPLYAREASLGTTPNSTGPTAPSASADPSMVFVQYQGPPALRRTRTGKWRHQGPLFCQALLTAAYHGVEVTVLGPPPWGKAWPLYCSKALRVEGFRRYLDTVPSGTVVFFFDAMDTLVLQGPDRLRLALRQLPLADRVIFSAERNCYPSGCCESHPSAPTTFRHVNAGGLVAQAGSLLTSFVSAWRRCTIDGHDDQKCANWLYGDFAPARRYRQHRIPISIDSHCQLFQTAWGSRLEGGPTDERFKEVEGGRPWIVNGSLVNPETGSAPALLHFNGWKGFLGYYLARLFPAGLDWAHPAVRDKWFTVWGTRVRGSDLCHPNATPRHM